MAELFAGGRLVVLWSNPENAEPCNPEGNTYGEKYYVVCEESDGSRMGHCKDFDTVEEAEKLARKEERIKMRQLIKEARDAGEDLESLASSTLYSEKSHSKKSQLKTPGD